VRGTFISNRSRNLDVSQIVTSLPSPSPKFQWELEPSPDPVFNILYQELRKLKEDWLLVKRGVMSLD
jgi:hypothetical protein